MHRSTTLHEVIEVNRPIEDVYRYLLDFSTIEQWDPGVYRSRKLDSGAPAVGTRFELMLNLPGGRQPMTYTLREAEFPHRIALDGKGANFSALDTLELSANDAQSTRISYRAELTFSGWQAAFLAGMAPLLRSIGRKAVDGLRTALSPAPRVAPQAHTRIRERLLLPAALDFTERGYLRQANKGLSERMDGKTVIVTGPTSGIGLASACEFARLGARVVLLGRDQPRLQAARNAIKAFSGCPPEQLATYTADLSLLRDAQRAAGEISSTEERIDVLVNNAGALFGDRQETPEGHERTVAINLLAPWLLSHALLPKLKATAGRIINVASGGMYLQPLRLDDMEYRNGRFDGSKAYARAKRALVVTTEHLATQHADISINAMHPGWAATPGVTKALPKFEATIGRHLRDARMGADTIVWLASSSVASTASGLFWFDRQPRPTSVVPGTATSAPDREDLICWLSAQMP